MQTEEHKLIMDDFNCRDINWSTLTASSELSSELCDLLFQYNLVQLIEQPIHKQGNILDLFIIDLTDEISTPQIHLENNIILQSNHYPIAFSIAVNDNSAVI